MLGFHGLCCVRLVFLGSSNIRRTLLFHVAAALLGVHICVFGINAVLIRLDEGRFDAFGAALKLPRALHSGEHRLQVSESNRVDVTWRRKIIDFPLFYVF